MRILRARSQRTVLCLEVDDQLLHEAVVVAVALSPRLLVREIIVDGSLAMRLAVAVVVLVAPVKRGSSLQA